MSTMRVQEHRKKAQLTQTQLANEMGVTQSIVSDWEREAYLPQSRQLPQLAHALGVTINELFEEGNCEDGDSD